MQRLVRQRAARNVAFRGVLTGVGLITGGQLASGALRRAMWNHAARDRRLAADSPRGAENSAGSAHAARTGLVRHQSLAIAALCLGIVGIVPPLGVVAVALGAVALSRLGSRPQAGRGLAVAGIVLGSLAVLAWAVILAVVLLGGPQRDASGRVTEPGEVFVEELTAGDCFNGGRSNEVDVVTVVPCETEHESQVVTTFELPDGSFPGEQKVLSAAEAGCTDRADSRP